MCWQTSFRPRRKAVLQQCSTQNCNGELILCASMKFSKKISEEWKGCSSCLHGLTRRTNLARKSHESKGKISRTVARKVKKEESKSRNNRGGVPDLCPSWLPPTRHHAKIRRWSSGQRTGDPGPVPEPPRAAAPTGVHDDEPAKSVGAEDDETG